MAFNTLGAQAVLRDSNTPRNIDGMAREAISGGQPVMASGGAAVVSSGTYSYNTGSITFSLDASGALFTGISLTTAGSNSLITVMRRGDILAIAAGNVLAGQSVSYVGSGGFIPTTGSHIVGRAITYAGSESYFVLDLGA